MGKKSSATASLIRKPKTKAGKRFLEARAPKVVENTKSAIFCRGGRTSEVATGWLRDAYQIKKPHAKFLARHNPFFPFDDDTGLEKFCRKYDASLFAFGQHSKKRPHNLILGRMFDFHVLDMIELGITNFVPMKQFKTAKTIAAAKPCLVFAGEAFETDPTLLRLQTLLLDFFGGERVERVRMEGVELLLNFTLINDVIHMRVYRVHLKAASARLPRVELEEMGPRADLVLRRSRLASDDLFKLARKQPKALRPPKDRKNRSKDVFGTHLARIHVGKQDINELQTRKTKALKHANTDETES